MHYYKRNLGDYAKKAGRLSMLQHGAYTLLIDACYDREQFPTLEEAIEWTWASTTEEIEAVTFVLRKFFDLVDGVYIQNRIQEELNDYKQKVQINTRIANERETKRKSKGTKRVQVVNEATPNQEPITNNQEPDKYNPLAALVSMGVEKSLATDWLKHRKKFKGEVTQRVIDGIAREAATVNFTLSQALLKSIERGWQSFDAAFIKSQGPPSYGKVQEAQLDIANQIMKGSKHGNDRPAIELNQSRTIEGDGEVISEATAGTG